MVKREVVHGFKALAAHLQRLLSRYQQSPILLLESHPLHDSSGKRIQGSKQVSDACRRVHFLLSQQLNLRTVSMHTSSDYEYAFQTTPSLPDAVRQMAQRTGADTIVAVGSGQAIDLAKAVSNQFYSTILVPATYGATMVAGTSHALLLDKEEEAIMPVESISSLDKELVIVTPDTSSIETDMQETAILAAISILLDAMLQAKQGQDLTTLNNLLTTLAAKLHHNSATKTSQEQICDALHKTGSYVSYGLESQDRSIPVALVASLSPSVFSEIHPLALMASSVPSLHRMLTKLDTAHANLLDVSMLQLAPKVVTTEPVERLLSLVHDNQAAWQCFDVRDKVYREALRDHLLVQ
ncbi:hypothetical protein MPSEU_001068500 [Mayamaea pseudoterrestris]|nr:hypothetical protein MPSEU_001068500 [Mayamaea pseudoterrestris]